MGIVIMATSGCRAEQRPAAELRVRKAAVAGSFYTGSAGALRSEVERFLQAGPTLSGSSRMLICPHAGYVFSGELAGKAYASVKGDITTVVLLGPSHRALFEGVSIADVDAYATPLGTCLLDSGVVAKLRRSPLVGSVAQAHREEHCLEVQVPFIQVAFPQARIVPIIMGRAEPAEVAELLLPLVDEKTLVVASSDLSHFHTHEQAKKIDSQSVETILAGDMDGLIDGCGEAPIRVLMHLAKARALEPVLLDKRNSYETAPEHSGPGRVVGYAAVAYVPRSDTKTYLLKLARASLEACVRGQKAPSTRDAPAETKSPSGCFVTLHKDGLLRGCIGNIEPTKALCDAVVDNARSAALSDPRFPRVQPDELGRIDVEVSVLTVPEPLEHTSPEDLLNKLVPGRDGVILESGFHRSTFLPQVWDQLPDKVQFLEHLSRKGGMAADGWKKATVKVYRAEHFGEE